MSWGSGRRVVGLVLGGWLLAGPLAAAASAQPASPAQIGLQASDVPGFTAQDPSVINITDPNDQGSDQAFIQCAGNTPLISQFDTGSAATESQVYGQGQNPFGTPDQWAATAVFTDGSVADAGRAYAALASTSFQRCWASTMDQLNRQQGVTVPVSPTTVTQLSTPRYGDATTGFAMNADYSVSGSAVRAQQGVSVIRSGPVVVMLLTDAYESAFPGSLRLSILTDIARRMGATVPGGRSLPVVDCPIPTTTTAGVTIGPGPVPATFSVPASVSLPAGLVVYGSAVGQGSTPVNSAYLLGPAGWRCSADFASADGGFILTLTQAQAPFGQVRYVANPGGIGPDTDLACPYIPAITAADRAFRGGDFCRRPAADQVRLLLNGSRAFDLSSQPYVAAVRVPPGTDDPGVATTPSGGAPAYALFTAQTSAGTGVAAQELACTIPDAQTDCLASLQFFLVSQSNLGQNLQQLDPGLLSGVLTGLSVFVVGTPRIPPSSLAGSLASPNIVFGSPLHVAANAAIALAGLVFITFPAQLFNNTFDEHYEEIRAGWERRMAWAGRWRTRLAGAAGGLGELLTFVGVLVLGGYLGSLLSPNFGFNLASVGTFVATLGTLLVSVLVSGLVVYGYRWMRRLTARPRLRALPMGLLIAAVCVAVSRGSDFQPGYLYGVVATVVLAGALAVREEGHLVALSTVVMLGLSIAGWVAWLPVHDAVHPNSGLALVTADDFLAALVVVGVVGSLINLIPFRFLPGGKLFGWHRGVWAGTFLLAAFAVVALLLRPAAGPTHPGAAPLVTVILLFVLFGGLSVAFAVYWGQRRAGRPAAVPMAGPVPVTVTDAPAQVGAAPPGGPVRPGSAPAAPLPRVGAPAGPTSVDGSPPPEPRPDHRRFAPPDPAARRHRVPPPAGR